MIQQSYSWGYTQKTVTQVTPEAPVMETAKMPHH
jgi:hypothetical protein